MDWFQTGKGVCQGCILSPSLVNFCAEYIIQNTGLDEAQAGIKISGRNNNLIYAGHTTQMEESKEIELKEENFGKGFTFPYRIKPGGLAVSYKLIIFFIF